MARLTETEQRVAAMTRIALATREKIDRATFALYLEGVAGYSTATVIEACRRIEDRSSWFPKKAELLEECRIVAQRKADAAEEQRRKRLPPAPLTETQKADILAKFRAVLERKTF